MIRVADYIAQTLVRHGIRHVFMVTGGGSMHLNDAIGRCSDLSYTCCHHEQACAMAAESYYRLSNRLAAVNVTTGPGGTNAITGVWGAWVDSLGMIVISGQVKFETMVQSTGLPLRQLGDQEIDIIRLVTPITKYAQVVLEPNRIRYHMEKAIYLAKSGRPGPCWLDVPMNVQGALVRPDDLPGYDPAEDADILSTDLPRTCREIVERLRVAERPVILAGTGVRLSGAYEEFLKLVETWGIPVTTAWNNHDLIWNDHPCYVGRPGSVGDRAGNFAVQNSDLLVVLGCRLNVRQVSYGWQNFARAAFKVIIDIDDLELKKPTISPGLPVHADVGEVLRNLLELRHSGPTPAHREWLQWCRERRERYPVVLPEYHETNKGVNPYVLAEAIFRELPEGEIVVTGDGTACVTTFQAAVIKKGQRLYTNSGCAAMGYDLPAAIGACIGSGGRRITCITGDGSIQLNLQELQTIVGHHLPIKLFVLNNQGYHSIRQTQNNYFPDNTVGCGPESGLSFPDFAQLAHAYGIPYRSCSNHVSLARAIRECVQGEGPQMCEVVLDANQQFSPRVSSRKLADGRMISAPLEDMYPFLDRTEFKSNMLIPIIEEAMPVAPTLPQ